MYVCMNVTKYRLYVYTLYIYMNMFIYYIPIQNWFFFLKKKYKYHDGVKNNNNIVVIKIIHVSDIGFPYYVFLIAF